MNICDSKKRTPIHLAAAGGHSQATMLLLEVGADMNAKDMKEYTAMAHAEANNHFNLMDRLVRRPKNFQRFAAFFVGFRGVSRVFATIL